MQPRCGRRLDVAREGKARGRARIKARSGHGWSPWRCEVRGGKCVVEAYAGVTELWHPIAKFTATDSAYKDAGRLVELVNGRQEDAALLGKAVEVLEMLEAEGLTFSSEMELDRIIERFERQAVKAV